MADWLVLVADEPDLQPVPPVAGVLEQGVVAAVAGVAAAEDDEEVEVAVVVPVGERDAVPLLEVAGAGRFGHVLEPAADVGVHQVGDQARQAHPARAEVEVEVAVVVDVAGVDRHDGHRPREPGLAAHFAEPAGAEVVVEVGVIVGSHRQAEVIGHDLGEVAAVVADEDIEPAVVVVVPEHAGEAVRRPDDPQLGGDVDERAVALVAIEPGGAFHVRDEQVEPAVVVVVAPGRPLRPSIVLDAGRGGDVDERAVSLVVIEPAVVPRVGACSATVSPDSDRAGARYSPQTNRSSRPSLS